MKTIVTIISLLLSVSVQSETYECAEHPSWPDDRKFSAKIKVSSNDEKLDAEIISLRLSTAWPLESKCDAPKVGDILEGAIDGIELKLSLKGGKECGFIFYITTDENNPAMLSPRKSYKVFGESPYLAKCNVL
jgi:hypothetical protein